MYQAYQGYFKNGRFISHEPVVIPENTKVYVMIVGDELLPVKTVAQKQHEAAQNFMMSIQKIRKELTEEDKIALDELESGKYKPIFEDRSAEL